MHDKGEGKRRCFFAQSPPVGRVIRQGAGSPLTVA